MRPHWEEVWSFRTARLCVVGEVTPCYDDPADQFDDPADVEAIRSGRVFYFDARVRVLLIAPETERETEIGADHLGGCAYEDAADVFRDHAQRAREIRYRHGQHRAAMVAARHAIQRRDYAAARGHLANAAEVRRDLAVWTRQERFMRDGGCVCYYGPGMVQEAIRAARKHLESIRALPLRTTA